jgi:murein DD-endopeptidase MepM/ murein hydrolase activator NlpD
VIVASPAAAGNGATFVHSQHGGHPQSGAWHVGGPGPQLPQEHSEADGSDDANVDGTAEGSPATNGGTSLPGDQGLSPQEPQPTAAPVTAYEMPFPCREVWTGSTRASHSPSVRAIDFNDVGGDRGKPVIAAAAGTVVTAVVGANRPSYGQYVVIDHGIGESSLYGHLDSVLVTVGQTVSAGTQLGTVGETGSASGPHLHFEERIGGAVIDAWFHGARFRLNSAQASQNCGTIASTDIPLAGDTYGGRSAEVMVFRKSQPAAFHVTLPGAKERVIKIGVGSDQPVLGDWDGNGRGNVGVLNTNMGVFTLRVRGRDTTVRFGRSGDVAIAGNWDGNGAFEVGVRRPSARSFLLRGADGRVMRIRLGHHDDLPVTGDWDGDGATDVGVYAQTKGMFTLRLVNQLGDAVEMRVRMGRRGDVPVAADWNGNGTTDLGVWSRSSATLTERVARTPFALARTRTD